MHPELEPRISLTMKKMLVMVVQITTIIKVPSNLKSALAPLVAHTKGHNAELRAVSGKIRAVKVSLSISATVSRTSRNSSITRKIRMITMKLLWSRTVRILKISKHSRKISDINNQITKSFMKII